jgi:CheY-like chemotaxis protein
MNILWVENHDRFAKIAIKTFLTDHNVTVVPSLAAARAVLAPAVFDVVMVDYDLDDGKGDALIEEILELRPNPWIIATSSHEVGNKALMEAGADSVCGKTQFGNIGLAIDKAQEAMRELLYLVTGSRLQGVEVHGEDLLRVSEQWVDVFAKHVRAKHGEPIYGGYRWHGFNYQLEPHLEGKAAVEQYQRQWEAPFYVFDEMLSFCLLCPPQPYPDLSHLHYDLYISHHKMKWTMVYTHEEDCGPYFAERKDLK